MTALCAGGGTSSPKPGVVDDVIYATGFLGLIDLAPGFAWLIPFIPLLGNLAYHTADLCATDPPGFATFTAGDALALAIADPGAAGHAARQKVLDTLETLAWYSLCRCDAGAQPAVPSATTAPTTPTIVPVPLPAAAPCGTWTSRNVSGSLTTTGAPVQRDGDSATQPPITPSVTTIRMTATVTSAGAGPHAGSVGWPIIARNAAGAQVSTSPSGFITTGLGTTVHDITIFAGTASIQVSPNSQDGHTITDIPVLQFDLYCNGTAPGATATPCPSDTLSLAILQQILDAVTLIQRQAVPFAYVPGTTHSVSGAGQLAVSGLLGAKVVITATLPGAVGAEAGDPEENFGLGWITWGSADGWLPRQFLGHTDNISLPRDAGALTLLGYSLAAGVTATITELVRES